jgi:1-acyl-sn-glycerol-3-phosphate acyltransferase
MKHPTIRTRPPSVKMRTPTIKRPAIKKWKTPSIRWKAPPVSVEPTPIRPLYYVAWLPVVVFMTVLCRRKVVKDIKKMPRTPVMVVANHMSHYDIITLALAVYPLRLSYMAKAELFNTWFLRNLFLRLGAFPVNRAVPDRQALRKANEVLSSSWALAVFPEGTRSPEGKLIRAHMGPALLALRNDVLILPVGIAGTDRIKERKRSLSRLLRRPQVTVHIGQPFKLPQPDGPLKREHVEACADALMYHVAALLPEEYRGVYGQSQSVDP